MSKITTPKPAPRFDEEELLANADASRTAARLPTVESGPDNIDALMRQVSGHVPEKYATTLHEADALEREANEIAARAAALRRVGLSVHEEWERLVTRFQSLTHRIGTAQADIDAMRNSEAERKAVIARRLGEEGLHCAHAAEAIIRDRLRLPLYEEAFALLTAEFRGHVPAMRSFVKANGLPADLLDGLPTF